MLSGGARMGRDPDFGPTVMRLFGLVQPQHPRQTEMVRAGAGLGILPAFIADRLGGLTYLLPGDVRVKRTFWLAVHEDVAGLKRNRIMADFIAETVSGMP